MSDDYVKFTTKQLLDGLNADLHAFRARMEALEAKFNTPNAIQGWMPGGWRQPLDAPPQKNVGISMGTAAPVNTTHQSNDLQDAADRLAVAEFAEDILKRFERRDLANVGDVDWSLAMLYHFMRGDAVAVAACAMKLRQTGGSISADWLHDIVFESLKKRVFK